MAMKLVLPLPVLVDAGVPCQRGGVQGHVLPGKFNIKWCIFVASVTQNESMTARLQRLFLAGMDRCKLHCNTRCM